MSGPVLDSARGRLVPVPEGGPIGGDTVGVPRSVRAQYGLLSVRTDELTQIALRLVPLEEVPDGTVAIGEGLAERLGLGTGETRWSLEPATPVEIRRLRIELLTETSIDEAVRTLGGALPGRVLWCSDEPRLHIDDVPYRVRALEADGARDVVGEITPRTEVEVFAAGVRNGVDIVILADCSGSMGVDDIEQYGEGGRFHRGAVRRLTRTEALRKALYDLLEVRLRVDGRVSRIALVEFTGRARVRFPRTGEMVELDGSSPPELVTEFRHAVATLTAYDGQSTDIGNALHEAANLLYYSGRPDNEKLIVLVSDGAHWTPQGDQGTGELVRTSQEPVSLMAHLHGNTGIRLHAIGISTPELYQRWAAATRTRFQPMLNPNHELLEQLVRVGGGDPTTIGGLDVLAEYFSGLGAGITRTVRLDPAAGRRTGRLSQRAAEILAGLGTMATDDVLARRKQLASELFELAGRCTIPARRLFGTTLFDPDRAKKAAQRSLGNTAGDDRAFVRFTLDMVAFRPGMPPEGANRNLLDRHAELTRFLDELRAIADRRPVDHLALSTLVGGVRVPDAATAIVVSAQHLLTLLRGWYEALEAHPPVRSAPQAAYPGHGGRRPDDDLSGTTVTGGFRLRE